MVSMLLMLLLAEGNATTPNWRIPWQTTGRTLSVTVSKGADFVITLYVRDESNRVLSTIRSADAFVTLLQLENDDALTIWTSAVAYHLRILRYGEQQVREKLDVYSRYYPEITENAVMIRLDGRDAGGAGEPGHPKTRICFETASGSYARVQCPEVPPN